MQLRSAVSAVIASLALFTAPHGWAQKGGKEKGNGSKEAVPEAVNRQFQWEERVVGPKTKGVDHRKIAEMQEQGRREDAARKQEPPPKKSRAEGVAAPATATLPTMDIEKPAPAGSIKRPMKKAAYAPEEPARRRDAIDDILADQGSGPRHDSRASSSGRTGLATVLAIGDSTPAPRQQVSAKKVRPASKRHHRRN
jgi:hypothetical protein